MKNKLSEEQRNYVLYHLGHHFNMEDFQRFFVFEIRDTPKPFIFFPSSGNTINEERNIGKIPILYPMSPKERFYRFDADNNLIFEQDLLKSVFYLLSGYQEWQTPERDAKGRFPYKASIQHRLKISETPLVNIYFDIIFEALAHFAQRHKLSFEKKTFWGDHPFAFFLTHDIDRVDRWISAEIKRRIKMALKRKGLLSKLSAITHELNIFGRDNSFWNFDRMLDMEETLRLKSTWFFLPRGIKHIDAYYRLNEKRIRQLARKLEKAGHRIGVHGVYHSMTDPKEMQRGIQEVNALSLAPVTISRQHWLRFRYPDTLNMLVENNISADSSWGFAEQCGWRNSYCLPFRPFDLDRNRIMPIWEIPLNAMDVTFTEYMQLDEEQTRRHISKMVAVCKEYGGIFTLLWHNNHLSEEDHPGIWAFYQTLLKDIMRENPYLFTPDAVKGLPK